MANKPCSRCKKQPAEDSPAVLCGPCEAEIDRRNYDTANDHPAPVKERGPGPPP